MEVKLGDAWFMEKSRKESTIGDVSKSQTDILRVADKPDMLRRDPVIEIDISRVRISLDPKAYF
jgi:hypothetical protein